MARSKLYPISVVLRYKLSTIYPVDDSRSFQDLSDFALLGKNLSQPLEDCVEAFSFCRLGVGVGLGVAQVLTAYAALQLPTDAPL